MRARHVWRGLKAVQSEEFCLSGLWLFATGHCKRILLRADCVGEPDKHLCRRCPMDSIGWTNRRFVYVRRLGFAVAQALLPDEMINFALDRAHEGLANTECDVLCSVIR